MCIFSDFWLHFFSLTKILLFYMWYFKTCLNNLFQTSFQVNDLKLPYSQQCLEAGTSRSVPKMASDIHCYLWSSQVPMFAIFLPSSGQQQLANGAGRAWTCRMRHPCELSWRTKAGRGKKGSRVRDSPYTITFWHLMSKIGPAGW